MLKIILSAIVSLGLGSFAFAQTDTNSAAAPAGDAAKPAAEAPKAGMDKKSMHGKKKKKPAKDAAGAQ